jgi:branched-chain amino acid transport system substrate-binding protein
MDVVRNLDVENPLLLPGIKVKTGEGDGYPIQSMQIMRFQGENWKLEGEVVSAED